MFMNVLLLTMETVDTAELFIGTPLTLIPI